MRVIPVATLPADVPVVERAAPLALDEAEFRAFHEQTARSLAAYLRRSLPADAVEDAVQEAYLRLLRTTHASLPVDERRAYLYRIAANLVNDAWRARKKASEVTVAAADTLAARRPSETAGLDVNRGMDRLRLQERTMLWLAYVDQASHRKLRRHCQSRRAACVSCSRGPARRWPPPWVFADEEHAMTDNLCPREADVLRASESATWPADLRAHVATCEACREVESVATVLRAAVAEEVVDQLPSADHIWWRAQWQARQDARARAMQPLDRIERAEPLVALIAVATLLVLRGDAIASRLLAWVASDRTGQALQAVMPPALLPILLVGAGLGALVLVVGVGAVFARD